ncbi:MAG: hypothetical protein KJO69_09845, partial [Gammaproteobacteria bacterium]|nr:hypothetical protein [Gammaproteobacteria bacterium]
NTPLLDFFSKFLKVNGNFFIGFRVHLWHSVGTDNICVEFNIKSLSALNTNNMFMALLSHY